MKKNKIRVVSIILILFVVFSQSVLASMDNSPVRRPEENSQDKYVTGEFIVKFKDDVVQAQKNTVLKQNNLITKKKFKSIHAELVSIPDQANADRVINALMRDKRIEYIEPNYIVRPMNITSDPLSSSLWGLQNVGQPIAGFDGEEVYGIPGIDINILEAWEITKGSEEVVVAVIDTGVDINHPDLIDRIWINPNETSDGTDSDGNGYVDDIHGWDFFNGNNSVYNPEDIDSHGTHVAGTIAASLNYEGFVGIAPNVKIMPLKFLGPDGGSISDAIAAIEYAADMGVKIANNSWGASFGMSGETSNALKDAIENSGMLFICAAGNMGVNIDSWFVAPASYDLPNILTVASINNRGELSKFSNYGQSRVHISAPGEGILSTIPSEEYAYWSGTSMATPHVSGVAALLLSAGIEDPLEIKAHILESAKPLISLEGKVSASGIVDAAAALRLGMDPGIPNYEVAYGTATDHYVAGRLDVFGYLAMGNKYGYIIKFNLYRVEGTSTWTDIAPN